MRAVTGLLGFLLLALCAAPARGDDQQSEARTRYAQGVAAYREGDPTTAANVWRRLYAGGAPDLDPAALAYNLGNAAFRLGNPLEAAAWYGASVRWAPRDGEAWTNLELARERAGLEPADRGDLAATTRRLVFALNLAEAERAVLIASLLLAAALAAQAWWGGAGLRRLTLGLAVATALCCVPWLAHLARDEQGNLVVIESGGAELRSEPRADATAVGRVQPGDAVQQQDELPGWVRVRAGDDLTGWLRADSVLDLTFGSAAGS
jgi:tetratricopeptide (TPR) repeat protein